MNFTHCGIDVCFGKITIPTYQPGPNDPNPPLFKQGIRDVYPYSWRHSFSTIIEEREYDSVTLVSPWLKLTLLPDWGFHLYRAVDRLTGRDMFHLPKVMKQANNAIRGAYVAGGVEFNFPVGHNSMTWDRVGLHIKKTTEGVSALFHNIDRCSGMAVAAGVTLRPDCRAIIFDQYLYNPTNLPAPWYYWLNAGITAHKSLRFLFPNRHMLGHFEGPFLETKKDYTYPIHNGYDYSKAMEVPEPVGLFSLGNIDGWFGAWYDDWNFAIVRWAPEWKVGGQKFWSWGNSEEGLLWGKIAADQDLPVPEIQSGRPEMQMDRGILLPHSSTSHREWWMPISDINNIRTATKYGALSFANTGNRTCVYISPAMDVENCEIRINGEKTCGLFPMKTGENIRIEVPFKCGRIRSIAVKTEAGTILHWENKDSVEAANVITLLDRPDPESIKEMNAEALYQKGFHAHRNHRPDLAKKFYLQALEKDAGFSLAHLQLGLLELSAYRLDAALDEFTKALDSDRRNDEALYLHGLASLWKGDVKQARADFHHAAATGQNYVVPSIIQLIQDDFCSREYLRAEMLLTDGLEIEPGNATLLFLKAVNSRRKGDSGQLFSVCEALENKLGVSLMADWEKYFAGETDKHIKIQSKNDTEDALLIDTALKYAELGAVNEATELLGKCSSDAGQTEAFYLLNWLGAKVSFAPKTPFFAYGRQIRIALAKEVERNFGDAIGRFSLGCLLADSGDLAAATKYLREATELQPGNSLYHITLGRVLQYSGKTNESLKYFDIAVNIPTINPLAWVEADLIRGQLGERDKKWLRKFRSAPQEVLNNDLAREILAGLCCDLKEFNPAINLMKSHIFHPYELTHHLRNLWVRIHTEKAVNLFLRNDLSTAEQAIHEALLYPENLQLGKPLRTCDAKTFYIAGLIAEKAKKTEKAKEYFAKAASEYQPDPTVTKPWSIMAKIRLGKKTEATEELETLISEAKSLLNGEFQPDLSADLNEIINLCCDIREGKMPHKYLEHASHYVPKCSNLIFFPLH